MAELQSIAESTAVDTIIATFENKVLKVTDVQGVIEHSKQHLYNILELSGSTVTVRFGTGVAPDKAVINFGNPRAAANWAATRIKATKGNIRGQFISAQHWRDMEAAAQRNQD